MARHAIAYVTDVQYLSPTLLSCLSLSDQADRFVFIDTDDVTLIEKAQAYVDNCDAAITVKSAPMGQFGGRYTLDHISPTAYGRWMLSELLSEQYDRVLYLDGDGLAGPVPFNLNTPLHGHVVGAVQDINSLRGGLKSKLLADLDLPQNAFYLNSGVLLIDLSAWRKAGMTEKLLTFSNSNGDVPLEDQHILNGVLGTAWTKLDPTWNLQSPLFSYRKLVAGARFFHFAGGVKPWHGQRWKFHSKFMQPYKQSHGKIPFDYDYTPSTPAAALKRRLKPIERVLTGKRDIEISDWMKKTYPEWL